MRKAMMRATKKAMKKAMRKATSDITEVFTLPPFSGQTPSDSTYPECQFFGSGMAGIVR
jgi:hypothetical protein